MMMKLRLIGITMMYLASGMQLTIGLISSNRVLIVCGVTTLAFALLHLAFIVRVYLEDRAPQAKEGC